MKVKIVTPDTAHAFAWTEALRAEPAFAVAALERPLREVNAIVNGSRPDLLLTESGSAEDFLALERLAMAHPEVDVVLVAPELARSEPAST